jgi:hypothetical protein
MTSIRRTSSWKRRARFRDAPSFSSHPPLIGIAEKLNRLDAMRLPGAAVRFVDRMVFGRSRQWPRPLLPL